MPLLIVSYGLQYLDSTFFAAIDPVMIAHILQRPVWHTAQSWDYEKSW